MTTLDDALLLSESVGKESYEDLLGIMGKLDQLEQRGVISSEGVDTLLQTLAELMVAQAVANDVLTAPAAKSDAPETEEPSP